jgi:hypothetical protein
MRNTINRAGGAIALAAALVLAGCGGGGSSSPPASTTPPPIAPPPSQGGGISGTGSPMSASGAITVSASGTVSISGVALATSNTTVRIEDRVGALAEVKDGMTGKVRGRINDDRVNGTAETIEIENEVRGLVQSVQGSVSPQRFTVNGQTVYVDGQTVYANLAGFASLVAGASYVEVHGLRDSTGAIRATRVEAQTQGAAGLVDEIRGSVTALGTGSFTLGSAPNAVTVTYTAATAFSPAGSSASGLQLGTIVEVHGSFTAGTSTFAATKIDFEDSEDSSLAPSGTDDAEVEGYVSGLPATEFKVGTRRVTLGASVRYEGGSATDLVNDARVEAEGNVNASGVLVASKIQFKQARIILQSVPTVVNAAGGSLTVLGEAVQVTTLTRIDARSASGNSTSLADIQVNVDCVEVHASLVGTSIVADEVKELSSGGCDWILRAPVEARDSTAGTVTMLGTVVNVNSAQFRDTNDAPIDRAAFFLGANVGTVVKSKGSNASASPLVAAEAELEN